MDTRIVAFVLVASLGASTLAQAQARERRGAGVTVTWTAIGAGAGFGVGLWAGLTAFDDAINSDRKVWTSAIVGAGVGALGGFFLGRALRSERTPAPNPAVQSGRSISLRAAPVLQWRPDDYSARGARAPSKWEPPIRLQRPQP